MKFDLEDTIVAIASGDIGSPRGVIRMSGKDALRIANANFSHDLESEEFPKYASLIAGEFAFTSKRLSLPCELMVWPDSRSYTMQPSVELHAVGSIPILNQILQQWIQLGARLAEPGEFTMRAFLAGRLDLTQAEAVLGVIDATARAEVDIALSQLSGGLAKPLANLREKLIELTAHLEAGLDFVEEDIEFISTQRLIEQLSEIRSELEKIASQMKQRGKSGELPRAVLFGVPNAGKSSLFNCLAGDENAIVADIEGTTRDYLTATIETELGEFNLVDTAGIESTTEQQSVDEAAQEKTFGQLGVGDVAIFCADASRIDDEDELRRFKEELNAFESFDPIVVLTKSDLIDSQNVESLKSEFSAIATSVKDQIGISQLKTEISKRLLTIAKSQSNVVSETARRCQLSIDGATDAIDQAIVAASEQFGEEIVASELRVALEQLGLIVGTIYTDDILDKVFSQFCIGK